MTAKKKPSDDDAVRLANYDTLLNEVTKARRVLEALEALSKVSSDVDFKAAMQYKHGFDRLLKWYEGFSKCECCDGEGSHMSPECHGGDLECEDCYGTGVIAPKSL